MMDRAPSPVQPASAAARPKGFWREQWLNIATLLILGIFGLIEQNKDGKFRIFLLPGWPTYAVAWGLYIVSLVIAKASASRPD